MPIERTAEQERAAIVAWLRDDGPRFQQMVGMAAQKASVNRPFNWATAGLLVAHALADAIKRGDHIEHSGETNNG